MRGLTDPLQLVHRQLVVGEALGTVPDAAPMVPLARDLDRLQRSLRLKPSVSQSTVVLDLRRQAQRDRSVLLHRLRLLGVAWGTPTDAGRTTGTFKEGWILAWQPEFAVSLVEAGLYGTTVLGAATAVVRTVTDQLEERLRSRTIQSVTGALDQAAKTRRPRHADIDWLRTIAANLKHYLPEYRTVVPERLIGHARRSTQVERHIVLCIDQSGSMAESIVYSSVFGAVLASLRTVATSLVVFDTQVVDLTEEISDPVDVLFGVQLGGGTDINRAIAYCQGLVRQPNDTVFVLISDLYEGGIAEEMLRRCAELVSSGVTMVALLALSDSGSPSYDVTHAAVLADIGVPAFACTPDLFPDLMAAAIERRDISAWAAANDVVTARQVPER